MPRLSHFGALLALATSLSAPASTQTSAPASARVQHVLMRASGAALEVEIQTSGPPVAPDTQAITGPDRIVVDFPGALPAAELRALKVNRGALKGIRAGLFFSNPPITRVVLDLVEPQSYQISVRQNAILVRLGPAGAIPLAPAIAHSPNVSAQPAPRLQNASLTAPTNVAPAKVLAAIPLSALPLSAVTSPSPTASATPLPPRVTVIFAGGLLSIRADKATLAEVLFEVHRQTQADIAIPAGAEQEEVVADLGPAPARDVLASLLNGSQYNFIFVGNELTLEQVILTRRDPSIF